MAESYTVAYQGVPGAYSEQAVLQLFNRVPVTPTPYDQFDDCFKAVVKGQVDFALLPLENTLGGSIHANYDLMLRYPVFIIGETQLRVRHCLLVNPGTRREDIKRVISHPQALAQVDLYIKRNGWKPEAYHDTAASGKKIKEEGGKDVAAVASSRAAEVLGLEILERGIEDDENNYTRFGLLSTHELVPTCIETAIKTSVVFSLDDVPGALFKAMACFSLRDIDLLKIESRPKGLSVTGSFSSENGAVAGNKMSEVVFYLDFLLNSTEVRAQNALRHLKELAPFLRVLGSYPVSTPGEPYPTLNLPKRLTLAPASPSSILTIAIVGFGTFGQFLAKGFLLKGHRVVASSRTDYSALAGQMGVRFTRSEDELMDNKPDVVVFCTSILSFESVLQKFPTHRLSNVLAVDVLSVKAHAKAMMTKHCPPDCDLLCTHPMFGPESGKHSWQKLPFVFEKVRITDETRCNRFLAVFGEAGCRMEEMSCEDHDSYAAGSQFITHATGRMLHQLGIATTPINTKGFESLLMLVNTTKRDSMDLFVALYQHNPAAQEQLEKLEEALRKVKLSLVQATETNAS
eukprot:EG_transcript_6066